MTSKTTRFPTLAHRWRVIGWPSFFRILRPFGAIAMSLMPVSLILCSTFFSLVILGQTEQQQSSRDRDLPHPWLAEAPGEFARLIRRGNVSLVVDDDILEKVKKTGLTQFRIQMEYKATFDIASTRSIDGASVVRVRGNYTRRDLKLHHVINIKSTWQPKDPWKHPLLQHEMDHVAITTDPRLPLLVDGVFANPFEFEFEWGHPRRPTNQEIQKEIDRYTQSILGEIEELLQLHYDQLDEESQNGLEALPDRSRFFGSLYSRDFFEKHQPSVLKRFSFDDLARWIQVPKSKLEIHYIIDL